jgi:ABC-2 type transport system permease protein
MKKRPNATPSGPAGHSRQAFQGGTYSLMLTAAVLALLIVLNLLVSALPTSLTQYPGQPMTLGSTDERGEDAT